MTDVECAWAAGFFDGEGSISIGSKTPRNHWVLFIDVSNTDKELLEWLRSKWGGSIHIHGRPRPHKKASWHWRIAANAGIQFLRDIQPFIRRSVVLQRIDIAIEFQAQKVHLRRPSSIPADYYVRQAEFYQRMRRLNTRGNPEWLTAAVEA